MKSTLWSGRRNGRGIQGGDPRLNRDVAIKVLHQTSDQPRLHRFEQEARAVAALSHPNVVAIFDVGIGDTPFLVTEFLDGETLRLRMARGRLTVALDPLSPWRHAVSALMFLTIGRSREGLEASQTALNLRADSGLGLWCAGMAFRNLNRHAESIATFERAVQLAPTALYLSSELGQSLARAGFRDRG
ncbi:MAG TPA: protein kinase, partial [Vicinamibacterales bacterium]|nr:protein kinase [Vicinamibacterales bacterium]